MTDIDKKLQRRADELEARLQKLWRIEKKIRREWGEIKSELAQRIYDESRNKIQ